MTFDEELVNEKMREHRGVPIPIEDQYHVIKSFFDKKKEFMSNSVKDM